MTALSTWTAGITGAQSSVASRGGHSPRFGFAATFIDPASKSGIPMMSYFFASTGVATAGAELPRLSKGE
ncbi:uncharacterized protein PgNI_05099 [Pyricularia grisea]|uniref:Uncharacterized protein n=1 Tax=Pyricularia grisea TaxID=148305 RepID=A0A6P8BCJ0_PYRGI|nr:uncharacterized protein PgNI_05099 [Pyricularia grisea]TLD13417.1 hypothetical protein PgNI_05099 [Pyricularia grisea]